MGVLPDIARGLLPGYDENPTQVIAQAGTLISIYALGVVVGAPVIAILFARMSQTMLIRWSLGVLVLATLGSAIMPTFWSVAAFRFASGLPHGIYLGTAALLAAQLLGPGNMGKGIAISMSGLTIANVIGVPLSTVLGQQFGWRWVYVVVAAVFAVTLLLIVLFVPATPGNPGRSARHEVRALANPRVWLMVGATAIGFGGFFAVYSYIADVTTREIGLAPSMVPWVTAVLGLGMVVGNWIGGLLADKNMRMAALLGLAVSATAFVLYAAFARTPVSLFLLAFLVSTATMTFSPALSARLIRVSNEARLLGAAMNHAAGNIANSLGAWLGGIVIAAGLGYLAPGWLGAMLAAGGFVLMLASLAVERRDKGRNVDTSGIAIGEMFD
ncbi:MFS transporter [Leucobacter denitrificans]|uniref:MFS transporter n=2 Tax=Leucobacter denitrificans TaxID=683042 RepID=A0A7G9S7V4_9MICO|nr:MFS transporter [Leucobacter denitrificans]